MICHRDVLYMADAYCQLVLDYCKKYKIESIESITYNKYSVYIVTKNMDYTLTYDYLDQFLAMESDALEQMEG
mgnify:FL=1